MIEPATLVETSPAGKVLSPHVGDFILTHENHISSKMIRFGQTLRFRGEDKKYSRWNHAAFVVGPTGELVEALGKGISGTNIEKYREVEYTIVRPLYGPDDISQAVRFALWSLGHEYGFLTLVGLGLWTVFGGRFDVSLDGTQICSGLVARCLERAGYIFERDPSRVTPADLAKHFQVV